MDKKSKESMVVSDLLGGGTSVFDKPQVPLPASTEKPQGPQSTKKRGPIVQISLNLPSRQVKFIDNLARERRMSTGNNITRTAVIEEIVESYIQNRSSSSCR